MSKYFSSSVGVGSAIVSILSDPIIKASSLVTPIKNCSSVLSPVTTKGLVNLQSGCPMSAVPTSSI